MIHIFKKNADLFITRKFWAYEWWIKKNHFFCPMIAFNFITIHKTETATKA